MDLIAFKDLLGSWTSETAHSSLFGSGQNSSIAISLNGTVYVSHHGHDGALLLNSDTKLSLTRPSGK